MVFAMRYLVSLLFIPFVASASDLTGSWSIDDHVMVLRDDGTFYASGYEPMDDQYGTYEVINKRLYFTYTMYDSLVLASYEFAIDESHLLIHDSLGYTIEYTRYSN